MMAATHASVPTRDRQRPAGRLHVCPLSAVDATLSRSGAVRLLTCLHDDLLPTPRQIKAANHLRLVMHDICEPLEHCAPPDAGHIQRLIAFAEKWGGRGDMVVHCWAGISRSTAAAFISLCHINPDTPEDVIAQRLRSASPTATPNRLMVQLADAALMRRGRMMEAVADIGRGEPASEAMPFSLDANMCAVRPANLVRASY